MTKRDTLMTGRDFKPVYTYGNIGAVTIKMVLPCSCCRKSINSQGRDDHPDLVFSALFSDWQYVFRAHVLMFKPIKHGAFGGE